LNVPNHSGHTRPLTEMSTRSRKITFLGSGAQAVRRADNLALIDELTVYLYNVESLTSHNPIGLHGMLRG
jgi:hypothetical protein